MNEIHDERIGSSSVHPTVGYHFLETALGCCVRVRGSGLIGQRHPQERSRENASTCLLWWWPWGPTLAGWVITRNKIRPLVQMSFALIVYLGTWQSCRIYPTFIHFRAYVEHWIWFLMKLRCPNISSMIVIFGVEVSNPHMVQSKAFSFLQGWTRNLIFMFFWKTHLSHCA